MKRAIYAVGFIVLVSICCGFIFRHSVVNAFHFWRMNTAYDKLLGNQQLIENGLGSTDLTGIDVDEQLGSYQFHRQALVDRGELCVVTADFPLFKADGSSSSWEAKSSFVERMNREFDNPKHYVLDSKGLFQVWIAPDKEERWKMFLVGEETGRGPASNELR